jgi:hypothetical protein
VFSSGLNLDTQSGVDMGEMQKRTLTIAVSLRRADLDMKSKNISALLIFASFMYLLVLGFLSVIPPKGWSLIESLRTSTWLLLADAALLLMLLGILYWWTHRRKASPRDLFLPAVFASLIPTACMLRLCVLAWFGPPLPHHVFLNATKKLSIGMTRQEVEKALGQPRGWTGDEQQHYVRVFYDLQVPWAHSKQFNLNFVEDRLVYSWIE